MFACQSTPTARFSAPGTCTLSASSRRDAAPCADGVGRACSSGASAQTGSSFQVARGHGSSSWLNGGRADAVVLTGVLTFFEVDTLTPLCGCPLVACDGATPDDFSFCWASAAPTTRRRQQINHAIGEARPSSCRHRFGGCPLRVESGDGRVGGGRGKVTDANYRTLHPCGSSMAAVHPYPYRKLDLRQEAVAGQARSESRPHKSLVRACH